MINPDVQFFISGDPVAQGRGQIIKKGLHYGIKDPEKSKSWKEYVKLVASQHAPSVLLTGPLYVTMTFAFQRPKSKPKWKRWKDTKPDLDNLWKGCADAMEGVIYERDQQICAGYFAKKFVGQHEKPGVYIGVTKLEEKKP